MRGITMTDIVHDVEHSTNLHALPPPGTIELTDGDRVVGWIVENRVGFGGFATEQEAAHAAWVAYRTMARRRAWENGSRPIPIDIEPLSIHRRAESDVVVASGRDVARLVRPDTNRPATPASFGFEITLPHASDELTLRASGYAMYRALRRSGIRWELWRKRSAAPVRAARPIVARTKPAVRARSPLEVVSFVVLSAVAATLAVVMVASNPAAVTILLATVLIAVGIIMSRNRPPRWRFRPLPGLDTGDGPSAAVSR
jgi:hypothetical protein